MKNIIKNIFIILNVSEKKRAIQLIFLDISVSLLDIAFLALLLYVIQFYTQQSLLVSSTYLPIPILHRYPLLLIFIFFILFSAKNIFGFHVSRMQLQFVYRVADRLSEKTLSHYLDSNYDNYTNIDSSVHLRNISQQPVEFSHYVLTGFQQILSQSFLILLTVVAILWYNPVLFLLLFMILSPPVILIGILMKKRLNLVRRTVKPLGEKTIQYLKEALAAFIESNVYARKAFFLKRYEASQSKLNHFLSEQQIVQNMPSRLIEIFAILGLFILILINSFTADATSVQIITIGAFMAAAYKIIPGIVKILNSSGQIKTYEFTLNNLLEKKSFSLKNIEQKYELQSVAFKNVTFRFKDEPVLIDVSFAGSKGDFIALSGISGKGKTTAINLLLGFLNPDRGSILINGIGTEALQRQHLWKYISYVKQQPLLIHDSILKNITFDENHVDFQKLEEVIRVTGLKDLITNYPEGFNKMVTENGKNLSGGQRQRIAIARALYKESDLIILDEPFSELDHLSEISLLNYFSRLADAGKMILLITHNKESVLFCNKMISLDEKTSAFIGDINSRLS